MTYESQISDFMKVHGLSHVLSFAGGYLDRSGPEDQRLQVESVLVSLLGSIKEYPIAILTGGTDYNFPGLTTRIAKSFGMKVIGILPEIGADDLVPGLDLKIVVPPVSGESSFGDETPVFVKNSDAMIALGGGPGAGVEIFQAIKVSLDRIYAHKPPIVLVPIGGFGGVTDMLITAMYCNDFPQVVSDTTGITSGEQIAKEVVMRLGLC